MPSEDQSAGFMARKGQMAALSDAQWFDNLLQGVPEKGPAAPATSPVQGTQSNSQPQGSLPGRIASDIGVGLVESPRAIVGGIRDAYQNTVDIGKEAGDYIEQKLSLPVLMIDKQGIRFTTNEDAKGHRLSDLATLPAIKSPTTVTGGLIKGIAQFVVGMKGAGNLLDAGGLPAAEGAAGYARTALQGAAANFAVFDPHQQRLSNLIERYPILSNPVTEFLQSKPDDGAAEGRFKNSLEGLGFGVLADGFLHGVRLLRSAIQTKTAIEAGHVALGPQEASDEIAKLLQPETAPAGGVKGDAPAAPVVTEPPPLVVKPDQAGAEKLAAAAQRVTALPQNDVLGRMVAPLEAVDSSAAGRSMEPPKTFINFGRIDTPEDVQRAMQGLADAFPSSADTARAGVRTFEQMKLDANHQTAWNDLVSRQAGQPLSDSQMLAARQLWASATDKLAQLGKEAAEAPSEANLFAFRKMLITHNLIQNEVLGARASIARAQASMRIPVGSSAERLREIQFSLEQSGGTEAARELAQAVDGMAKAGMLKEMAAAAEKGAFARTVDAAKEAWTLGLLTSPKTHLRNVVSNTAFMPLQVAERKAASIYADFLGDQTSVQAGEASAQYFGSVSAVKDMFRYYGKMIEARIGGGVDAPENPIVATGLRGSEKLDLPQRAISSDALQLNPDGWLGRGVDAMGSLYGLTSHALTAEDNFFKVAGYRGEIYAQAFRQVRQELASGTIEQGQQAERMADLILNPPENIRLAATDQALYQTFNQAPGYFGKMLLKLKRKSLLAHVLIPFARTTTNLQRAAFERTPLAPLVGQWRADMVAGGARRDLALARWSLGSMVTLAIIDATTSGQITGRGPADPGQRQAWAREGWRPYSWKLGDRWWSYNGISPIGDQIGMAADLAEIAMHGHQELIDGKDMENLTAASIAAVAGNVMNKSYLSGFSNAINALNDPAAGVNQFKNQLAGSVIPTGVGVVARAIDPNVRAVNSMMDAIRARIPGLSQSLPQRHDLWGAPMVWESGLGKPFDAMSPVFSQKPTPEPIDQEIIRNGVNLQMPAKNTSFDGVTVDFSRYPAAYERYVQLAGNELKHPAWGFGAKDLLNQIVSGKHPLSVVYGMRSDGPEGGKDVFIRDTVSQYREMARRQVLQEFPEIAAEVGQKKDAQRALRMPVLAR